MNGPRCTAGAVALIAASIMLTGCTSESSHPNAISVRVSPPSSPVQWDPCTKIADRIPEQFGFDPATRERTNQPDAGASGCRFDRTGGNDIDPSKLGWLTIMSMTNTMEHWSNLHPDEARVAIDGREAIKIEYERPTACTMVMAGPDGTVSVRLGGATGTPDWKPCDLIDQVAQTIEAALP
ncbi:DUF3558 domain-containing protein [Nocardia salmonicida]|uniref:DUF3558 domain-containing protein n=1 Tax=Nocardia salmonicida TaxID=53431 RepID=A0ABZ1NAD1_9NOCA